MKKTLNLFLLIFLFLGYMAYLLLEIPLNSYLEGFSLPPLYQGYLSNIILLLPLLIFLIYLLFRLNLEKSLSAGNRKIYLIPAAYLLFVVVMGFSAYKNALSWELLFFLFGLCLVGFSEEFLFRGILFEKFSALFSSIYFAAIVSSFLFGIGHYINLVKYPGLFNEVTAQVIYAFCIGILMCGLFYKTKSLVIPALIHTIFNLEALIGTFNAYKNKQIPVADNKEVFHPPLWELLNQDLTFLSICLITGFMLIYYQNKKERKTGEKMLMEHQATTDQ